MEKLENYTLKQVSDLLINKMAKEKKISKTLARKLFINSLCYSYVANAIEEQVNFLMGKDFE